MVRTEKFTLVIISAKNTQKTLGGGGGDRRQEEEETGRKMKRSS